MTPPLHTTTDARSIHTARVLNALYWDRTPGFHFAGHFLRVSCDQLDPDATLMSIDVGAHCLTREGAIDGVSLCIFADLALAIAVRAAVRTECRLATVDIQLQFTGQPVGERLSARARFRAFHATAPHLAMSEVDIVSGDALIATGQASFMVLPIPEGRTVAPLRVWQPALAEPTLNPAELTADESAIYRAARRAAATEKTCFSDAFWGARAKAGASGATSRLAVTPQVANRVGHVQGGILLAQAMHTALAAMPPDWATSSISANYLAPGMGSAVLGKATPLHTGRSTAASRVQLRRSDRTPVVEAQTTMVAPKR
ncbi:MAG: hotdog domain-containing protein [Polaromonas sp.]|nr:hotdog domain-containing protein [Polaromonas sp.]